MLKIALAQMEIQPGHPDKNTEKMLSLIAQAKKAAVDLIIFPEMAIPGYLLGDTWEQTAFLRTAWPAVRRSSKPPGTSASCTEISA